MFPLTPALSREGRGRPPVGAWREQRGLSCAPRSNPLPGVPGRGSSDGRTPLMNPLTDNRRHITRRALLGKTATGVGLAALAHLLGGGGDTFGASLTGGASSPSTRPSPQAIGGL